jgi:hypothetical protein
VIESAADRLALVRDAGEVIEVDGKQLPGIFIAPYQPVPFGEHVLESAQPQVVVIDDNLPAAYGSGSVVTIRGTDYGVADTQPDGTGLTTIRLRKRS